MSFAERNRLTAAMTDIEALKVRVAALEATVWGQTGPPEHDPESVKPATDRFAAARAAKAAKRAEPAPAE